MKLIMNHNGRYLCHWQPDTEDWTLIHTTEKVNIFIDIG